MTSDHYGSVRWATDKHVYYVGDSISFDGCATYTNAITVAVGESGVPVEASFVWDCGRYNPSVYSMEEGVGDHIVITARLPDEDVRKESDGTVTLTVPATAQSGFMILKSGDAKVAD